MRAFFRVSARMAIAGFAILTLAACSVEARRARHWERGERYFKEGEYEKAKIEYANLLRLDPRNARAFHQLGFIWLEEGAPLRAAPLLAKATDLDPNDANNRLTLAKAFASLGRNADARKELITVLEQNPVHAEAIVLLADTDRTKEDIAFTEEQLQKFGDPDNASVQLVLANLAAQKGDLASAEAPLQRALTLEPQSPSPHLAMANYQLIQKNLDIAGQEYKAAAELSAPRSIMRLKYAEFKAQNGAPEEAKAILKEITRRAPDALAAWSFLSKLAISEEKYDEAQTLLENVTSRDVQNVEARLLQATVWRAKGETKKAVGALEDLAKTYANVPVINYELGRAYVQDGNVAQAAIVLNQAIAAKPDYLEAILLRGDVDVQTGNASLVVPAMVDLLRKRPHLLPAELLLIEACLSSGQPDQAVAIIREQIRASPEAADPYYRLGLILHQQNKNQEARLAFEKVSELTPGNLMAINQLVDLDIEKKDFDSAMRRVQSQLENTPPPAVAYFMQGKIYVAEGKSDQAEAALLKALELDSNSLGTYQLLISTYLAAKKFPQAIDQLQTLLSMNPNETRSLMSLASTYERIGEFSKARDTYERFLSVSPDHPGVLNRLAGLYAEQFNQPDKALELANKARTLEPLNPAIAHTLGWLYYKRHEYQQALDLMLEAVGKSPDDPQIQFHFGLANYMMDQPEAARTAFKKAVNSQREFPSAQEARRWLAFLEDDSGAPKQLSINELEALAQERPTDLVVRTRLAALYEKEGAVTKAAAAYEAALNTNPKLVDAALRLAQLYAEPLHNPAKALELAKTARDLDKGNPKTTRLLGKIAFETGNFSWSYDLLVESAHNQGQDAAIAYDLAWAAYSLGKVPVAEQSMRRALELRLDASRATDAKRFLTLVDAPQSGKDMVASEDEIQRQLKESPDYVPALMLQASLQMQRGQVETAMNTYAEVLRRFPDFAPAQKYLAALYMERPNSLDKAYELAIKARKTLPNDADLARTLGEITYQRKAYDYSLQLLEESARTKPLDAKALYYLGMSYFYMQQQAESDDALKRSLAAGLPEPLASEAKRTLADLQKQKGS